MVLTRLPRWAQLNTFHSHSTEQPYMHWLLFQGKPLETFTISLRSTTPFPKLLALGVCHRVAMGLNQGGNASPMRD